ncbi:sigma-70 family RNA polymerase sigma factor [Candidatus Peregrinibacteria bacterium]|nr:sigma-70 family RNA polymerase sigma factor [Candidatus Peregrinibacteria bacterium]
MDLYVERQCIIQMKESNPSQFLLLFDANFEALYKYVFRRVGSVSETEKTVRLAFLDALGQVQSTPNDTTYIVWLYSLARPRVFDFLAKESFPAKTGFIEKSDVELPDDAISDIDRAEKMMKKLSLEEREILRLKLYEQITDGDVMVVLGMDDGTIGTKIYRVLKRAHLLLFGERNDGAGAYFGELSAFFEKVRMQERTDVSSVFKMELRMALNNKIESRDFAVDAEVIQDVEMKDGGKEVPFKDLSSDPAKIFAEAAKGMDKEEIDEAFAQRAGKVQATQDFQNESEFKEVFMEIFDKWRGVFIFVPVAIFVIAVGIVFTVKILNSGIERGYPTACKIAVSFSGDFSDGEKRNVNAAISDKLCGNFLVNKLVIAKGGEGVLNVEVDVPAWFLEYRFVLKNKDWRIKKYERTAGGDQKSRKISGNFGGAENA